VPSILHPIVPRVGAGVLVAVLLAACGSKPPEPPKPVSVSGRYVASADLNPSVSNRPSPLLMRVYELRSATAFNRADFMALYQADNNTLAADLVLREETMLQPGETRVFSKVLSPDTRFVAVVGAYRELERSTWRAVVPVPAPSVPQPQAKPGPVQLVIRADARAVSATVQLP
jgi:type VI secretion system protein VasD